MHTHPALQLKERLLAGNIIQVPGAYDALSARLVERAGFPAASAPPPRAWANPTSGF